MATIPTTATVTTPTGTIPTTTTMKTDCLTIIHTTFCFTNTLNASHTQKTIHQTLVLFISYYNTHNNTTNLFIIFHTSSHLVPSSKCHKKLIAMLQAICSSAFTGISDHGPNKDADDGRKFHCNC